MPIFFETDDISFPDINERVISDWINEIANSYNKTVGDITFIFCSDDKILEINIKYLSHDYYTDIITFDYSEDFLISGDIFISLDTVLSNSQKYNTDYEEELYRVIIHGVLHLCGINDKSEAEQKTMTEAEEIALNILKSSYL